MSVVVGNANGSATMNALAKATACLGVALLIGCRREPTKSEAPTITADVTKDAASDGDSSLDLTDAEDALPPPDALSVEAAISRPKLAHFAAFPLATATHGIDGTIELWRDARITDAFLEKHWFRLTFEDDPDSPPPFAAANAMVVVKDAAGRIVQSRDLAKPLATMEPVSLGDAAVPYFMVSVDTFSNGGSWDGTTHVFVRVEAGHARWLDCATLRKGMRVGFAFDKLPGGGSDILSYWISTDGWTKLARIAVDGDSCRKTERTVPGMRCETSPCAKPAEYPTRE